MPQCSINNTSLSRSVAAMITKSSNSTTDKCDQDHDFKTQLLIMAGVAVVLGLAMCMAGGSSKEYEVNEYAFT